MKVSTILLSFILITSPYMLFGALLPEEGGIIYQMPIFMTLQELLPDNDASEYFAFYEDAPGREGELDLSSANIYAITGENIKLTSIDGIENLKIFDGKEYLIKNVTNVLILNDNGLTDLPDQLQDFTLSYLSVANNRLPYIPWVIYYFLTNKLVALNIEGNQIEELPGNFSTISAERLNALTYFNMRNNPIEKGIILDFLKPIPALKFVGMVFNGKIKY